MHRQGAIAAVASPAGACARIVLRVSGDGCRDLIAAICAPDRLAERAATRVRLLAAGMSFPATILTFAKGASYTGEESAELHIPGNPLLARLTLQELYNRGVRPAEAGEFTARAFFNGRLNLSEAEGIAATIAATNQRELDAARGLQNGALAAALRPIMDELTQVLALLEAGIDFAEEDIRFITAGELSERSMGVKGSLAKLLIQSAQFESLSHEPALVLTGRPNAGKSTLLNRLAGRRRAIVSDIPGTTRDLLSCEIALQRGMARLIDTAGLESGASAERGPRGEIRRQMRHKALSAIEQADVLILVHAADDPQPAATLGRSPDLIVMTKSDLPHQRDARVASVSAVTGAGVEELRSRLDELAFGRRGGESLALNARHRHQLEAAITALDGINRGMSDELLAEHLRSAMDALGEITGLVSVEDVLGRIFSTFCIGK